MSTQGSLSQSTNAELAQLQKQVAALTARLLEQQTQADCLKQALGETTAIKDMLDSQSVVIITDRDGRMRYVNESFCQLCQYSREELLGENASYISSQYHSPSFWQQLWTTILSGQVWQGAIRNQTKDGSFFWIDMVITPLRDEQGEVTQFIAIRRDTTRERQIEAQVRFQAQILSQISDAVVGIDEQERITYWNKGAERLYGKAEPEVLGKPLSSAFQAEWSLGQDRQEALQRVAENSTLPQEMIHWLPSGAVLFVEVTTQLLTGEQGKGSLSVIRNITERMEAKKELERTLEVLTRRNYELDNYVYKVSHDLRAPLSSILGLINLIHQEADPEVKHQYVNLIENRAHKLDHFIQSVLAHSRMLNVELKIELIDLISLVKEAFEELKYYPNWHRVKLTCTIEQEVPFYSDQLRLNIILENLLSNAIKYLNPLKEENLLELTIRIESQQVLLIAQDNGIGIDKEYLYNVL